MQPFTSKELYMMNGGQKLYIYKDGFGDIYNATAEDEAQWAKEVIEIALHKIATEENSITLQHAIDNLKYHKYPGLEDLLLKSITDTSPKRQIVFATALWKLSQSHYEKRFDIVFDILLQHRAECVNEVFSGLNNLKNNMAVRHFLVYCLDANDADLFEKAQRTLFIWAYSGLPELRENRLLETLQWENKNLPSFQPAIERIKQILNTDK